MRYLSHAREEDVRRHVTALGRYLEQTGQTHEAFAEIASVPAPMISLWVRGLRRPGLDNAVRIAKATNERVPVSYWTTVRVAPKRTKSRIHPQ